MRHTTGAQDTVEIRLYRDLSGVLLNVGIQCWVNYLRADAESIPRDQEIEIVRQIVGAQTPLLIHASGGVGKSVLCSRIEQHLPADSAIVIYDCFANGDYRRAGSPRHRHKDALVQIANELASMGLCEQLTVKDLANAKVREALEKNLPQADSQEVREFREEVGALLPWHALRTRQLLAPLEPEQLSKALDNAKSESSGSAQYSYRERSFTSDEIAELWFEILAASGRRDPADIGAFHYWVANQRSPLFIPTWTQLARLAGRTPGFKDDAYNFVQRSSELNRGYREDAESKAGSYLDLARASIAQGCRRDPKSTPRLVSRPI
jgi:hypothetical protein